MTVSSSFGTSPLTGRRVLITGAARGIGAALARRLHHRQARVALAGLEPEPLAEVSRACGGAPWWSCDVRDRDQVEAAVAGAVEELGGLDVVVANAGTAGQMPIIGGDPSVLEDTLQVNVVGVYNTLRAAGPHISHERGYALVVSSLAAAVKLPLLGAYGASKAAVEVLGDTLNTELKPTGARAGVAYFAELDTDMTHRGFGTRAAATLTAPGSLAGRFMRVTPLETGIDALERGISRRSRRVVAPWWVGAVLPARMAVQPLVELVVQRRVAEALEIARAEDIELTTPQPADRPK